MLTCLNGLSDLVNFCCEFGWGYGWLIVRRSPGRWLSVRLLFKCILRAFVEGTHGGSGIGMRGELREDAFANLKLLQVEMAFALLS